MKTILVTNPKGGVGKSTICDEIVYGLRRRGYEVAYINLDNQGGGVHEPATSTDGADWVVVDTPGSLTADLHDWMDSSDIVIIPTLASQRDLRRLQQTWNTAKQVSQEHKDSGDDPLYGGLVINRYNPRALVDQAYMDMCQESGMHIYGWLPDTTQIKQAEMSGKSIVEYAKRSKYAERMEALIDQITNRFEF